MAEPTHAPDAFHDALETRPAAEREAALMAALPRQLAHAQSRTAVFAERLAGVDAQAVRSRAALASLPVTRKHELLALQQAARAAGGDPFGGFSAIGWGALRPPGERALRVFASPGPIYEPEGAAPDYWRMARAMHAAGFRAGELIHNAFSYHFTPAGAMVEGSAHALGCTVFPGGTGQTEQQVQAIAALRPAGYIGTPSFLKIILDRAAELGVALPSLGKALVSGEAFTAALRDWLAARGVTAYQCYATADLGLIAYETSARAGLVIDEGVIVEIVRPGTCTTEADGEVGELVVTTLNPAYPLVRFGTGDLSAVLPGPCPSGRTNTRIRGWLGRADQTAKVRGMFVHPGQVAEIARRFPEIGRARLVVSGELAQDTMTLHAELPDPQAVPAGLTQRLVDGLRELTKLRADVLWCTAGSLPNDGKLIDDLRAVG